MASMTGAFVLSGPLSYPHYLDGQGGYACEQAWGRNGPYGMDGPYGLRLSGLSLFPVLVCSTIMLPVHPINDQRVYRWDKCT